MLNIIINNFFNLFFDFIFLLFPSCIFYISFYINIGQITLIFNNDTGRFQWVDFGWGYCDVYEDNPYGIIADTAQEFLDKFHDDEIN